MKQLLFLWKHSLCTCWSLYIRAASWQNQWNECAPSKGLFQETDLHFQILFQACANPALPIINPWQGIFLILCLQTHPCRCTAVLNWLDCVHTNAGLIAKVFRKLYELSKKCGTVIKCKPICFSSISKKIWTDMTKPTKWLCAKRRLRSAWASAQSDQRLRMKKAWVLSYGCPGWSQSSPGALTLLVLSCHGSSGYSVLH